MKVITLLFFLFGLSACSTKPAIHKDFKATSYNAVMLVHLQGDTANYVYKKFIEAFANAPNTQLMGHDQIVKASISLGLGSNVQNHSISNFREIARVLNAQGILLGQVKSGAMSISSSLQIYSSITLDLIDIDSGKTVISQTTDEEMTLRESGSSLKEAANKMINQYEQVFTQL